MTAEIGTQASILAGFLAIVVALSVNSIREEDKKSYRAFVATFGLASLGPIFVVLVLSVLAPGSRVGQSRALTFSLISLGLILFLLVGTIVKESTRGLDSEEKTKYVLVICLIVVIWYALLFIWI